MCIRDSIDAAQSLAQIARTTDKRHLKFGLINMIDIISRGEDFALIDVVDLDRLENLRLDVYKRQVYALCLVYSIR